MPRRPDIDAAVEHIGRYASRDEWTAHRREHLATMLGRIPEHFSLDLEGLFEEVRRLGHLSSMVAFIDESFLAAEYGPDRANVTDDYLRRRGWQETPRGEYLQAIRTTPPGLYEVCDVAFGEWIEVRDRLRGGSAQRIVEHSGSQTLQRWDCFVARVVHPRDETMLTGGVLSLTRNTADGSRSFSSAPPAGARRTSQPSPANSASTRRALATSRKRPCGSPTACASTGG